MFQLNEIRRQKPVVRAERANRVKLGTLGAHYWFPPLFSRVSHNPEIFSTRFAFENTACLFVLCAEEVPGN